MGCVFSFRWRFPRNETGRNFESERDGFPGSARLACGRTIWWISALLGAACFCLAAAGCGSSDRRQEAGKKKPAAPAGSAAVAKSAAAPTARDVPEGEVKSPSGAVRPDAGTANSPSTGDQTKRRRLPPGFGPGKMPDGPRDFADLIAAGQDEPDSPAAVARPAMREGETAELLIDDTKAAVAGIRKLAGKHLALYTDALPHPDVDDLTDAFDAAVPLWCQYFEIPVERAADWRLTGFLMQEQNRFLGTGMLPDDLPPFPNGYHRGNYLWMYDQTEAYYRRHLLLHEGTHAFMEHFLGSIGPPWYAEGMAELLGTHRWQDGHLTLAYLPQDRSEAPGWGRVRIIKDEAAAGRGMMPATIMDYGPTAHQRNEPYGWCWGLAMFLDLHPLSQDIFRQLRGIVRRPDLTSWFRQQLQADWPYLNEEWQLFVMNADYGYDVGREVVVRRDAHPLPLEGGTATIAADRGWQSTGFRLEGNAKYRLVASGRYKIGQSSGIWWCEPGGITLHYHQGRPLGLLLGAVRDDSQPPAGLTPLARPRVVGLETTLTVQTPGTLYLRINESAAGLSDNEGQIEVQIIREG